MCKEYINLQTGKKLDLNILDGLEDNSALKVKPEIWIEWDFEKNNNLGIDILTIGKSSKNTINWICHKCCSEYQNLLCKKILRNQQCGYCSGRKVNYTNSLLVKFPELSKEWSIERNLNLTPNDVIGGSHKKVWWKCPTCNSEYQAVILNRTKIKGSSCPYCAGKKVNTTNSLSTTHEEVSKHWDYSKNKNNPDSISKGSHYEAWWICSKCENSYNMRVYDRIKKDSVCNKCKIRVLNPTNSLRITNPELIKIFDTDKNIEYNLDNLSKGSKIKLWWKCSTCDRSYDRTPSDELKSVGKCPYCMNKRVDYDNSLLKLHPELMDEWDYNLNKHVKPDEVSKGSHKKAWWKCKLGHIWEVSVANRVNGSECPYCYNRKVWVGFNDMWTTRPDLAELLLNSEDGHKYTRSAFKKVDWKCPKCNYIIRDRLINNIARQGLSCPNCNDNIPFGEKIVYQLLSNLNINFQYDNNAKFSKKYRYDFILPDHKLIIETHGLQHYKDTGFSKLNGKSLNDEINNDLNKESLAIDNGYRYISIDTSTNDLILLKNEILNSELATILNITEESFVGISLNHSLVLECWKLYYEDKLTKIEISKKLKIGRNRVAKYIKLKNQVNELNDRK